MGDQNPVAWEPYLSVVVASRNDDHGGRLVERIQAFIDGLQEQSEKYKLDMELVIVEWNPPPDRARMSWLFRWPTEGSRLHVRIIEVPHEIHARYEHSDVLPIFQMIAKNVGIRRARGRFVLATNPDLLFTDDIVKEISQRRLREDSYYRAERDDVPTEVLERGTLEERLGYSKTHLLRAWTKEVSIDYVNGTRTPTWQDERRLRGLHFLLWGAGLVLVLNFLERKYGVFFNGIYSRWKNRGRHRKRRRPGLGFGAALKRFRERYLEIGPRFNRVTPLRWMHAAAVILGRFGIRVRSSVSGLHISTAGITRITSQMNLIFKEAISLPPRGLPRLFTYGCGDFTLMSRGNWTRLRGYLEIPVFSLMLDSIMLYLAFYGGLDEVVFGTPCFHIEHAGGWAVLKDTSGPYEDLRKKGVPILGLGDLFRITKDMGTRERLMIPNAKDWGLGNRTLREINPLNLAEAIAPSVH